MFHLGGEGGGEEAAESNTAEVGDKQREEGDEPPKLLQKHVLHLPVDVFFPDFRGSVIRDGQGSYFFTGRRGARPGPPPPHSVGRSGEGPWRGT